MSYYFAHTSMQNTISSVPVVFKKTTPFLFSLIITPYFIHVNRIHNLLYNCNTAVIDIVFGECYNNDTLAIFAERK